MSLVDTTFASIPAALLADWGQNVTYVKAGTPSYNTTTGTATSTDTSITIRAIFMQVNPEEFDSNTQTTDTKLLCGNAELGDYIPNIRDHLEYTQGGTTQSARIINVKTIRGDFPILHALLLRPQ